MMSKECGCQQSDTGAIPQISTRLTWHDHWGTIKSRFDIHRMHYSVKPGLYALNAPDEESMVLVSANYKMSFDALRKELKGIQAWVLVLDTKGINVWCAAGKGTFGTEEIIRQVKCTLLDQVVKHKQLIVPQLGAPGIAAHEVKKESGFQVLYGPVRAKDIAAYVAAGRKITPEMRRVQFPLWDRMVLIPVEIIGHMKYVLWALLYFAAIAGFSRGGWSWTATWQGGLEAALVLFAGLLAGTVLVPIGLPYIPGKAFAWKGALVGVGVALLLVVLVPTLAQGSILNPLAWLLMLTALASFSGMNFTGTSTYTSLSGVLKEMKLAIPMQIIGFASGVILWTVARFL
jgi:CO dehydrogenase/acetyl-CoA synthase delta subunit